MKKKKHTKKHMELSDKFRALAHPARVKLVEELMEKEFCVGEIQRSLSISQPNVSQHLKILKKAGIVKGRREKTKICYSLVSGNIKNALQLFLKGEGSNE